MALAVSVVYGLAVEYGGGSFAELAVLVVPPPTLLAFLTVSVLPRASARLGLIAALTTALLMAGGGLTADALGKDANEDRLLRGSRNFTCNGPRAEMRVPAEVDRTDRKSVV